MGTSKLVREAFDTMMFTILLLCSLSVLHNANAALPPSQEPPVDRCCCEFDPAKPCLSGFNSLKCFEHGWTCHVTLPPITSPPQQTTSAPTTTPVTPVPPPTVSSPTSVAGSYTTSRTYSSSVDDIAEQLISFTSIPSFPFDAVELISGEPNVAGAVREVSVPGVTFKETLVAISNTGPIRFYSYDFPEPALGALTYQVVFQVLAITDTTCVVYATAGFTTADEAALGTFRNLVIGGFHNVLQTLDSSQEAPDSDEPESPPPQQTVGPDSIPTDEPESPPPQQTVGPDSIPTDEPESPPPQQTVGPDSIPTDEPESPPPQQTVGPDSVPTNSDGPTDGPIPTPDITPESQAPIDPNHDKPLPPTDQEPETVGPDSVSTDSDPTDGPGR